MRSCLSTSLIRDNIRTAWGIAVLKRSYLPTLSCDVFKRHDTGQLPKMYESPYTRRPSVRAHHEITVTFSLSFDRIPALLFCAIVPAMPLQQRLGLRPKSCATRDTLISWRALTRLLFAVKLLATLYFRREVMIYAFALSYNPEIRETTLSSLHKMTISTISSFPYSCRETHYILLQIIHFLILIQPLSRTEKNPHHFATLLHPFSHNFFVGTILKAVNDRYLFI
jgi:hypothetical protein